MNARMLSLCASLVLATACGPRQVQVRTAPTQQTQVALEVNNTLAQGVNVYFTLNGQETFLRQVPANSKLSIPVQGIAAGSTVTLRATTVDGTRGFSRQNVVLNGTVPWSLP